MPTETKLTEGWQAEKVHTQRIYHYIVGTFSLCRKLGFYTGELMPDTGKPGREDCKACVRLLEKRKKVTNAD